MSGAYTELPNSWDWQTLDQIRESDSPIIYGILQPGPDFEGGIPYVRPTEIQADVIQLEKLRRTSPEIAKKYQRSTLRMGDIVFSIVGTIGKVAFVPSELDGGNITQSSARIRADTQIADRVYVFFFLKSPVLLRQIDRDRLGMAVQRLNLSHVRQFQIPLAPLAEQRRIVAKIEALQERSQSARTALDAIPPLLEKFRQSVLAAAFRGDLTGDWRAENPDAVAAISLVEEVPVRPSRFNSRSKSVQPGDFALAVGNPELPAPEGWDWVLLADIARLETGHTPSRKYPEYWGGDVPWLSIPDARVHHSRTIPDTSQHTNELGLANSAARLLPIGTVCLSRTASVGYVTVMGQPMATSQDFVDWVCTSAVNPHWLKWLLVAEKQALLRFGKGSTHKTIYFPEVLSFNVCLPPREEQDLIVRRIEERFALAQQLATVVDECTQHHSGLDPAILAKAFRGELVPQLEAEQQEAVA